MSHWLVFVSQRVDINFFDTKVVALYLNLVTLGISLSRPAGSKRLPACARVMPVGISVSAKADVIIVIVVCYMIGGT